MSLKPIWEKLAKSRLQNVVVKPKFEMHWCITEYVEHHEGYTRGTVVVMPSSKRILVTGSSSDDTKKGLPACFILKKYVDSTPPISVEFKNWHSPTTTTCQDCFQLLHGKKVVDPNPPPMIKLPSISGIVIRPGKSTKVNPASFKNVTLVGGAGGGGGGKKKP